MRWLARFLEGRRFPHLFVLTAIVFLLSLVIPDALPFVDELLLLLVTATLGALRRPGRDRDDATSDGGGDGDGDGDGRT